MALLLDDGITVVIEELGNGASKLVVCGTTEKKEACKKLGLSGDDDDLVGDGGDGDGKSERASNLPVVEAVSCKKSLVLLLLLLSGGSDGC